MSGGERMVRELVTLGTECAGLAVRSEILRLPGVAVLLDQATKDVVWEALRVSKLAEMEEAGEASREAAS